MELPSSKIELPDETNDFTALEKEEICYLIRKLRYFFPEPVVLAKYLVKLTEADNVKN